MLRRFESTLCYVSPIELSSHPIENLDPHSTAMPSITARMRGRSPDEPEATAQVAAGPRHSQLVHDGLSVRRAYRRLNSDPTRVNPRPLPTVEECRAARQGCMYYGFYAGQAAIQKMIIKCFPEELEGRMPCDPNLFLAGIEFIRDITNRPDIGVHTAYVAQRNRDAIPSIGLRVGAPTFIVGLFPLEKEAYMHRITQENVDMLEEFFGTKPSWWEIKELSQL